MRPVVSPDDPEERYSVVSYNTLVRSVTLTIYGVRVSNHRDLWNILFFSRFCLILFFFTFFIKIPTIKYKNTHYINLLYTNYLKTSIKDIEI